MSLSNLFKRSLSSLQHASPSIPPSYTLATLRSFPSLEPHSIIPILSKFINTPIRRDILWLAVTMELDNKRVGSSNPPGRSDHKFSRAKVLPQKGTGRARAGDANSPIRFRGAYALARNAPNDFTTKLPMKVYSYAYRIALSSLYKQGKLFIIGKPESETNTKLKENDSFKLEICTNDSNAMIQFIQLHKFNELNILFIVNELNEKENLNLRTSIKYYPNNKITIMRKEDIEVKDILKANRVILEQEVINYFADKYCKSIV
ncbi:hypothetical protein CANARDRAFT_225520 [[Candida] arabinofermentans NRRL YB-2248]|uniref:Large ribosomal subunit protein uL4m n=1 Tax=[Candida] arabinofermentans NRRL YB-2248 TaxID=983967 RepID=A0A1E4SVW3_9ASCO|nr:hypothetical protein CANARDRAFT_225520 [[Candida] arabinofermentans NRRL YB-2248]